MDSLGKVGRGEREGAELSTAEKHRTDSCLALPTPHCLGESQCAPSQSPLFLTFLTFIHNYPCEGPDNHISRLTAFL